MMNWFMQIRSLLSVLRAVESDARGGGPSVDGKYIAQSPFDPEPAEFSKDVAMLIGTNLNEFHI